MYFIGVDLGTSAVKLLLMEESGKICNIVSKEYPLFFPHPGWSEQNPEDWYTQSMAGMKELTEGIDRSQVAGISFGGQMHGLVTLDDQDQVIRPAILWNDGRTSEETDYLNNVIGKDKLSQYTANIAFAGFTAPKILWMKKNRQTQCWQCTGKAYPCRLHCSDNQSPQRYARHSRELQDGLPGPDRPELPGHASDRQS